MPYVGKELRTIDLGGAHEVEELHRKGLINLQTPKEIELHKGTVVLSGASPVSRVLAAHEIAEIIAAAKSAPGSQIKVWCLSGAESAKDISKAMGKQEELVDSNISSYLHSVNAHNPALEDYLNQRGFSTSSDGKYPNGQRGLSPAIHFYSEKTPPRTILAIPSTVIKCPEPDKLLKPIEERNGDHYGIVSETRTRLKDANDQEPTVADILHTLSLVALGRAIELADPHDNQRMLERVEISGHIQAKKFLEEPAIMTQIGKNIHYGTSNQEAVVGFCCLDCSRQKRSLAKHHISTDGNPRNSNGAGIQRCRDGRTLTINHVQTHHEAISQHQNVQLTTSVIIELIRTEQVYSSGKITLAAMCVLALANDHETILCLRNFPKSRNTYSDMAKIAGLSPDRPLKAAITPTFEVSKRGNPVDSPMHGPSLVGSNFDIFTNNRNKVEIDI